MHQEQPPLGAETEAGTETVAAGPPPVRCRLCGRVLTGSASRRTGLGPACDAKLRPAGPDVRTRRHEVEQDALPGL